MRTWRAVRCCLLGNDDQIRLARETIKTLADRREAPMDALLVSLRDALRGELDLRRDDLRQVPVVRMTWGTEERPSPLRLDDAREVSFADWAARTGASVASAASASSQPTSGERRPNLLPASVDLSHDIARLRELATAVPGVAVVTGYGHVTAALMRLLDAPEEPQAHDAPALARMAADRGLVTDQLVETVQGLTVLKDLGVRGGAGTGLSVEQANEYIDLVGAALYVIYHRKPDVDLAS
jgi:hypothetical protein